MLKWSLQQLAATIGKDDVLSVRARGGKAVMKAARSRIAAIAMLAAGTAIVLGQLQPIDRANAADPVRERAEDWRKPRRDASAR
jgi:hypothetical protein